MIRRSIGSRLLLVVIFALALWLTLTLTGCTPPEQPEPDRQLQREIFMQCLDHAPAGPVATRYNDWSEVIDECGSQAYYLSFRERAAK